jgi:hypothetical protein
MTRFYGPSFLDFFCIVCYGLLEVALWSVSVLAAVMLVGSCLADTYVCFCQLCPPLYLSCTCLRAGFAVTAGSPYYSTCLCLLQSQLLNTAQLLLWEG